VGRAEVVTSNDDVRTVAIAEPKIADAAVGSARTVVVNGKSPGVTTLVVYSEGARYKVYDVECYTPNYNQQVMLKVRMAEVNDNAARQLGFDWFGQGHSNRPWLDGFLTGGILTSKISPPATDANNVIQGLSVGPETDGFLGYLRNANDLKLEVTWKALEEKGDLRTLATPTLVTRSGQPASFLSGGEIPVPIATGTGAQSNTVTIEWKEFGVKLDFTPTVEEDNSITLKVAPEISQVDFSNVTARTTAGVVPSLVTRKASTTVNLRPGEHLAIGGLKQTDRVRTVRKVPILGYIPVLGFFFTDTQTSNVDHDLLVVVSPELIQPEATLPPLPTDKKGK
jgi:pilus assembly protein CpaC